MIKESYLAIYEYLNISGMAGEFSERHCRGTDESWEMFSRGGTYLILICTPLEPLIWLTEMFSCVKWEQLELSVSQCSHGQHHPRNLLLLLLGRTRGSWITTQVYELRHAGNCRRWKDWGKKRPELSESFVAVQRALNIDFTICTCYDASTSQSPYSCFKKEWGSRINRKKKHDRKWHCCLGLRQFYKAGFQN